MSAAVRRGVSALAEPVVSTVSPAAFRRLCCVMFTF